jgi:hypothetical protein
VKVLNVPRPARKLRLRRPRFAGFAAFGGMPGAFCHGIVKNQQGLAAELFPIGSGEGFALLNLAHSREKYRKCKIFTSAFHTLP